ncbi:MAG TPA: coenzyme F420-0:L-glutamate ligase [Polyangiaceae bacterium]|nr:coenzyme F420-0:L-glutamate ligase [Polyangiaceae bacterium]
MRVLPLQTHKITSADRDLFAILDAHLPAFGEGSVLAISSKIIAIAEGRVVPIASVDKQELVAEQADRFLPASASKWGVSLTITNGMLIATAGIDESNSDGHFVLWPSDVQRSANALRSYLVQRFGLSRAGVVITDSRTSPLRIGVTGVALAHSGFRALNDYVGVQDLFGRALRMTKVNVMDALATAAVLVMGEGNEQTPLAVIDDAGLVQFQDRDPSAAELEQLRVSLEDDLYAPLLERVPWQRKRG